MPNQKPIEFDWVDAFSSQAFQGNGCAVVYNAESWDETTRLQYVRETSLTECTFLSKSGKNWRVQYYLASREIPFAGHPTIATAWSLFSRGLIKESAQIETGVGTLEISIQNGWVSFHAPLPKFGTEFDAKEVAEIYGLIADDIMRPPQLVESGIGFVITLLRNQNALDCAQLDHEKLSQFQDRHKLSGFVEPYLVTLEHDFKNQAHSLGRLLLPPPNPAEDPFTGSATGLMASWLFANELAPARFINAQGHCLGRMGFAKLHLQGTPKSINSLKISGEAHILMRGVLTL